MSCLCQPNKKIKCLPLNICVAPCCNCGTTPSGSATCGCLPGLRATLGYLQSVGPTDIRIFTIAQQQAFNSNNVSITRFYPDANDSTTATLVEFSNGVIVSLCNLEIIESSSLIDNSADKIPDHLKELLDETIREIPASCINSCENQLRLLFEAHIGQTVSNIDTNANNRISGQNNTVRGTGAGVALINLNNGTTGSMISLCYVADVTFA